MKIKLIIILVVLFLSLLAYKYLLYLKEKADLKKSLTTKCYFAYKQTHAIAMALNYCAFYEAQKLDMPTSGALELSLFKAYENRDPATQLIENMPHAILHRGTYVDPFISGEHGVTITNWRYKQRDDWTPRTMSLRGSPLDYMTDKKDIFLTFYAGPDGDYDYDRSHINLGSIYVPQQSFIILDVPFSCIVPFVDSPNVIQYDPTNGLISNGDIVWPIYRSKEGLWVRG